MKSVYNLDRLKRDRNPYLTDKQPPTLFEEFAKLFIGIVAGTIFLVAIISISVPKEYQKQVYESILIGILAGTVMSFFSR